MSFSSRENLVRQSGKKARRDDLACGDISLLKNNTKNIKQSRQTVHEVIPAGIYSVITLGTVPLELSRGKKNSSTRPRFPWKKHPVVVVAGWGGGHIKIKLEVLRKLNWKKLWKQIPKNYKDKFIIIDYLTVQLFLIIFQLYAQNLHFIYLFLFRITALITWNLEEMKRSGWTIGSRLVPSAMQRKNEECESVTLIQKST